MLEKFNEEVELVDAPVVETPAVEAEAPKVEEEMMMMITILASEAEEVTETPAEEVATGNEEVLVEVVELVDVAC